ncbi:MAG: dependent epimerase/dehydratase family protein [Sporomusa sp.]|jgi:nucleoside-diphosphate-sugar epimerase|nr:dependent epimerase/dehydratase family protein [Sporomusa sp.]
MRILITGADGFIGRHLIEKLLAEGHKIFKHTLCDGDIAEKDALGVFGSVEHVFHLAARTFVPASFEKPYEYFHTNVMGTINALEFCRKYSCSMTFMSTYVYGEPKYLPVDEKHPIIGITPYHQSKITCEGLCEFYSRQFNIPVTILRPFNVYGKGQSDQFLIPTILKQLLDPETNEISVMDLQPKRDYIYIDDLIKAMLLTMKPIRRYSIYNVGSGFSKSVEEVIVEMQRTVGIHKTYQSLNQHRKAEVSDCVADISAIKKDLGFTPRFTLLSGLQAFINK